MKLNHLFETTPETDDEQTTWEKQWSHLPDGVHSWLSDHSDAIFVSQPSSFSFKDGELSLHYTGRMVLNGVTDDNLPPWKWGAVGQLEFKEDCTFTDLTFLPRIVDSSLCFSQKMSLKGIHKRVEKCDTLMLSTRTTSGFLDVLKIKNLAGIGKQKSSFSTEDFDKAFSILVEHVDTSRDLLDCQSDLIDAGLGRFI